MGYNRSLVRGQSAILSAHASQEQICAHARRVHRRVPGRDNRARETQTPGGGRRKARHQDGVNHDRVDARPVTLGVVVLLHLDAECPFDSSRNDGDRRPVLWGSARVSNACAASSRRDAKARRIHARREAEQGAGGVARCVARRRATLFRRCVRRRPLNTVVYSPIGSSARPGESLRVRVWHAAAGSQAFRYSWSVDGGHIEGTGRDVAWTFGSVRPGYYKATVQIAEAIGAAAECSVRVVVVAADGSRGFETTRALLARRRRRTPRLVFYSYLLLEPARRHPGVRQRYLSAITSYLSLIRDSEEFLKHFERRELNITYVPVTERPQGLVGAEWVPSTTTTLAAAACFAPFDLTSLSRRGRPRVLAVERESSRDRAPTVAVSGFLDGSPARRVRVGPSVHHQAAQERFEQTNKLDQLVLKLRNALGILAESVPDIVDGLKTSISLVH